MEEEDEDEDEEEEGEEEDEEEEGGKEDTTFSLSLSKARKINLRGKRVTFMIKEK